MSKTHPAAEKAAHETHCCDGGECGCRGLPRDAPPEAEEALFAEEEARCGKPCAPDMDCKACELYWHRMKDEGFWKDGTSWTNKGMKEMRK